MTKPNKQTKLLAHHDVFNELVNLYLNKNLPNKIILSGYKGIGKSTLAYHLANYILSQNEEFNYNLEQREIDKKNKTFNLIASNTHINFFLISLSEGKKNIEILQVRELLNYLTKTSFNNLPKIILIDDCEYLNKNSSNSLLKVLEEPPENVYFFLIQNSQRNILETIKSRCIEFKIFLDQESKKKIINNITQSNYDIFHSDFKNNYFLPKFYLDYFEYCEMNELDISKTDINLLLENIFIKKNYKRNSFVNDYLFFLIQNFFYIKFKTTKNKDNYYDLFSYFIKRFDDLIKYNLDFDSFIIEFKNKVFNEK